MYKKTIAKDLLEPYLQYGVDKDNRRIFLDGEITQESSQYIRRGILYLDSLNHEQPIELWICSSGGDEYCAMSIYDTLRTVKCPIHTVATGLCMSAAPLLVAGGEKNERYATPNCYFMVHQTWDEWVPSRIDEQRKLLKHYEIANQRWYELMASHTKLTIAKWKKICESVGDHYFDAEVAKEYGIIDHIWSERDEI